jgi:hypothetical protein
MIIRHMNWYVFITIPWRQYAPAWSGDTPQTTWILWGPLASWWLQCVKLTEACLLQQATTIYAVTSFAALVCFKWKHTGYHRIWVPFLQGMLGCILSWQPNSFRSNYTERYCSIVCISLLTTIDCHLFPQLKEDPGGQHWNAGWKKRGRTSADKE